MGEFIETFGKKESGQLILAADWNSLVAAIETTVDNINVRIDGVETALGDRLDSAEEQLGSIQGQVNGLETTVDVLRAQHRVTLSTTRTSFALGQVAIITAQVTDFEGNPLPGLNSAGNRPWVDFFTAWGQLKAVAGFTNVGGAGERTLSVRVNADGVAQVTLRAESTEDLSDQQESEVLTALMMTPGNSSRTLADEFLAAPTPMDAMETGAFGMMTAVYDGSASLFRDYVDAYYVERPRRITRRPTIRWRDYNSTVIAMTKNDDDPQTPDRGRGYGSIRIRFRDWIQPWILLDYLGRAETHIPRVRERLIPRVSPERYGESLQGMRNEIEDIVQNQGIIGRMREYNVIHLALERIQLPNQPAFWPQLVEYTQSSVNVQQTMEFAQANTLGLAKTEAALAGFAAAGAQNDVGFGDLGFKVEELAEDVAGFRGEARKEAREEAQAIAGEAEGRFAEKLGLAEQSLGEQIESVSGKFDGFDSELSTLARNFAGISQRFDSEVPAVQAQLVDLEQQLTDNISRGIATLQKDVGVLQGRLGEFDRVLLADGGQFQSLRASVTTLEKQIQSFEIAGIEPSKLAVGLLKVEEFNGQVEKFSNRVLQLERQRKVN